ncbi:hypothetical protein CWATWH0402_4143 [Crocosphaera watsonii WH 0402]|uniref:ASCH domain-containing protein n=1 Tax=Crocosphaera watsonii WH 0402 TaxID=1284629 RepID=T2JLN6_CROWT|nr:ASCH domain-containing protein [Crocosphaera watsonii]CCQ65412.1 hypothetical protein CWATWH0402_4143 [Crocosphaera watsonii WH 0402]
MNKQINQISGLFQESREPITKIKAISLHQPYASLIAMGLKKFETRSWSTNYRGKLVICAAKKIPFNSSRTMRPWRIRYCLI